MVCRFGVSRLLAHSGARKEYRDFALVPLTLTGKWLPPTSRVNHNKMGCVCIAPPIGNWGIDFENLRIQRSLRGPWVSQGKIIVQ